MRDGPKQNGASRLSQTAAACDPFSSPAMVDKGVSHERGLLVFTDNLGEFSKAQVCRWQCT